MQDQPKARMKIQYILRENGHDKGIHFSAASAVAVHPNGHTIVTGARDGQCFAWPVSGTYSSPLTVYEGHAGWVNDACFLLGGKIIATVCNDTRIRCFDSASGQLLHSMEPHCDYIMAIAKARRREKFATAGLDGRILFWDMQMIDKLSQLNEDGIKIQPGIVETSKRHSIYCVDMSADGRLAASGSIDGAVRVWDVLLESKICKLKGHKDVVRGIAFAGDSVWSTGSDGTLRRWNLDDQKCVENISFGNSTQCTCLTFHEQMDCLLVGTRQGEVYRVTTAGQQVNCLADLGAAVVRIAVHDSGPAKAAEVDNQASKTHESKLSRCCVVSTTSGLHQISLIPSLAPQSMESTTTMRNRPGMRAACILADRQRAVFFRSDGSAGVMSLLTGAVDHVELRPGEKDVEDIAARLSPPVVVPSWCEIDCSLAGLRVSITQSSAFLASVTALGSSIGHSARVNLGKKVLDCLFREVLGAPKSPVSSLSNSLVKIPGDVVVMVTDSYGVPAWSSTVNGRMLQQTDGATAEIQASAEGDEEGNHNIPVWVKQAVMQSKYTAPLIRMVKIVCEAEPSYAAASGGTKATNINDTIDISIVDTVYSLRIMIASLLKSRPSPELINIYARGKAVPEGANIAMLLRLAGALSRATSVTVQFSVAMGNIASAAEPMGTKI